MHGGPLQAATWNVEGLSFSTIEEVIAAMKTYRLDLVCLTETHTKGSEYYVTEGGYLVILSGAPAGTEGRVYTGVGFIVAPKVRRSVIGFNQRSDRLARLKLRVSGGKCVFIAAYAPHGKRPHDERQQFYSDLSSFYAASATHGACVVAGDLNARIHRRLAGEDPVLGPFVFGSPTAELTVDSNRSLLMELCTANNLVVANTCFDEPPEKQVTYYDLGAQPFSPMSPSNFAQLDLFLIPDAWLHRLVSVKSIREAGLASHHFLVNISMDVTVEKVDHLSSTEAHLVFDGVKQAEVAQLIASSFDTAMQQQNGGDGIRSQSLDDHYDVMISSMMTAAEQVLPQVRSVAKRPWISPATLALIDQRSEARRDQQRALEIQLNAAIRKSSSRDREQWLNDLCISGDWKQVRKLRSGGPRHRQARLRDMDGIIVDSSERADTMAIYLEKVQWAVRPCATIPDRPALGLDLPVDLGPIKKREVLRAAKKLKYGRACGTDGVPGELWRAIAGEDTEVASWAVEFCQRCWSTKEVPTAWHTARVAAIHKKGDESKCENYRPISLLQIGYKLFASIMLARLMDAGSDQRIWTSQYGFRPHKGTSDAILIARRVIEDAWACRDGSCLVLALDWAKAFDSVSTDALLLALRRFGVPSDYIDMVSAIYRNRVFSVRDAGKDSGQHRQHSGISQGCPLSPYLFVIVMTMLMKDARDRLTGELGVTLTPDMLTNDLLYADDMLLMDVSGNTVQQYMNCVGAVGAEYGLQFNWGKLELLKVRSGEDVYKPTGERVVPTDNLVYLGSTLSADGQITTEISRRIGRASGGFKSLARIWNRSGIKRERKLEIFNTCVISGLIYGMETAWLPVACRRRLDGFQARCLRSILKIPPPHLSFVSNQTVRDTAQTRPVSSLILERQIKLFGKAASAPPQSILHRAVFHPGTQEPRRPLGPRSVGRPRMTWAESVHKELLKQGM